VPRRAPRFVARREDRCGSAPIAHGLWHRSAFGTAGRGHGSRGWRDGAGTAVDRRLPATRMRLVTIAGRRSPATLRSCLLALRLRMPLRRLPRLLVLSLSALLRLGSPLLLSLLVVLLPLRLVRLQRLRRLAPLRCLWLRLAGLRLLVRRRLMPRRWLWPRLTRLRLLVRRLRRLSLRCRALATAPLVMVAARAVIIVRVRGAKPGGNDKRCTEAG